MYLPSSPVPLKGYQRALLLLIVFVAVYLAARQFLPVIHAVDYQTWVSGVRAMQNGNNPYNVSGFFLPPWSATLLVPLITQPVEVWLALTVAIFVTSILDIGKPSGLLLVFHPAFLTLLASSNGEWLLNGTGLWLLYRAPYGWGRGLAWVLLTSKPQTTAF